MSNHDNIQKKPKMIPFLGIAVQIYLTYIFCNGFYTILGEFGSQHMPDVTYSPVYLNLGKTMCTQIPTVSKYETLTSTWTTSIHTMPV
jgi:hypothetical protein